MNIAVETALDYMIANGLVEVVKTRTNGEVYRLTDAGKKYRTAQK